MFAFSRRERRAISWVLLIGTPVGAVTGWLLRDPAAPEFRALLIGALAGLLCPAFVIVVREGVWHSRLVRLHIVPFAFINLALNGSAILVALLLAARLGSLPFAAPAPAVGLAGFAIASGITVALTAWFTLDRALGPGVLTGLLTGQYHRPRRERRIFLFADLAASTAMAQELGDLQYHTLLNRIFGEISRPIDDFGGAVHRYLGDEMIVTWPETAGLENAACLRCAVAILETVQAGQARLRWEFGVRPRLRIGLHGGDVVTGELSGSRAEIVHSGDAINTAARLAAVASQTDYSLVISGDLLTRLAMPDGLRARLLDSVQLRGRADSTDVFVIEVVERVRRPH